MLREIQVFSLVAFLPYRRPDVTTLNYCYLNTGLSVPLLKEAAPQHVGSAPSFSFVWDRRVDVGRDGKKSLYSIVSIRALVFVLSWRGWNGQGKSQCT